MKVEAEVKITILEGKEKGRTFVEKTIADTEQRYTELGVIETLRLKWNKLVPYDLEWEAKPEGEQRMTNEQAIEILKNIKEWFQDEGLQYDVKALVESIEALENQKSIIAELEKIKAEIELMDFDFGDYYDNTGTIIEMVSKVIDKYISELKEESKQSRCNNCLNNTDELSGECYECVKGIKDNYIEELKGENE